MGTSKQNATARAARDGKIKAYDRRRPVAKRITRKILAEGRWSKESLARHIGCHTKSVEAWARGETAPTLKYFDLLQKAACTVPPRYRKKKKNVMAGANGTVEGKVAEEPLREPDGMVERDKDDEDALFHLADGLMPHQKLALGKRLITAAFVAIQS